MKIHQLLVMIYLVATSAMASDCPQPASLNDDWEVTANVQAAGFDAVALCAVLTEIDNDKNANNMHAILVARRRQLIAERYFTGRDKLVGDWF